ncbi:hypothetical protein FA13DRAFT_70328 [Coprinellus micaceus]|uniref:Uncharacterized protein n=1 Tax=Coprinellus micaceus TaxID=71717 RepID=A0A4Y7TKW5_COPMI|nr:hypothetical protein FA13DRAFT_70328 [Coprinellus micaceus]
MAHNAYYPPPTPLGQQPPIHPQPGSSPGGHQYAQHPQQPYYQQPQNIYQQLGQAQPQPHLQRLYQQQQGQYAQQPAPPAQPAGYGQQQSHGFVQRPLSTSFQPPQHAYAPPTTPFQQPPPAQQQPYPTSQQYVTNQYASSTLQQPPRPPISRTPSAQGFVQPNAYAGQGYMAPAPQQQELNPPVMASMISQQLQRRSPQPPPPAPSALLAQQTRLQRQPSQAPSTISQGHPQPMQMQMRQQPPAASQNHVMQMQQRTASPDASPRNSSYSIRNSLNSAGRYLNRLQTTQAPHPLGWHGPAPLRRDRYRCPPLSLRSQPLTPCSIENLAPNPH